MQYDNFSPAADKWLHMDGSVTTMAGDPVLPADPERAEMYKSMSPIAAKWLLPDGTVVDALPTSCDGTGGNTGGGVEKRAIVYNAVCNTAPSAARKDLTGLPDGYSPVAGDFIMVKFGQTNSATYCAFRITNSATDYEIRFDGNATGNIASLWNAGSVAPFYFDGSCFHQLGSVRRNDNDTIATSVFTLDISGMKLRINSDHRTALSTFVLERTDDTFDSVCLPPLTYDPANVVNTGTDFKIGGLIWYHFYSGSESVPGAILTAGKNHRIQDILESTFIISTFNGTTHLQNNNWVFLVGIPQADPMAFRLDPTSLTSWYTTEKPASDDGKIYIRLGYFLDANKFALFAGHPAYWFKNGYFRPYLTT